MIRSKFRDGEPARDLLARLAETVEQLEQLTTPLAEELPPDCRAELEKLAKSVGEAAAIGETWLREVGGPKLHDVTIRKRLLEIYKAPP